MYFRCARRTECNWKRKKSMEKKREQALTWHISFIMLFLSGIPATISWSMEVEQHFTYMGWALLILLFTAISASWCRSHCLHNLHKEFSWCRSRCRFPPLVLSLCKWGYIGWCFHAFMYLSFHQKGSEYRYKYTVNLLKGETVPVAMHEWYYNFCYYSIFTLTLTTVSAQGKYSACEYLSPC